LQDEESAQIRGVGRYVGEVPEHDIGLAHFSSMANG
jgi:hypothetical protein